MESERMAAPEKQQQQQQQASAVVTAAAVAAGEPQIVGCQSESAIVAADDKAEGARERISVRSSACGQTSKNRSRSQEFEVERRRRLKEEAAAEGDEKKELKRGEQSASKLHEWLAKEIKSKFSGSSSNNNNNKNLSATNTNSSSSSNNKLAPAADDRQQVVEGGAKVASGCVAAATAATATGETRGKVGKLGGATSSLLDALIEGRKSWLEEKTVIVDIKNGRRRCRHQAEREKEIEIKGKKGAFSLGGEEKESELVNFESFRQLDDSIELSEHKEKVVVEEGKQQLEGRKAIEEAKAEEEREKSKEKKEEEEKEEEEEATNNSSTLAAKASIAPSSHKSSSAKQQQQQQQRQRDDEQLIKSKSAQEQDEQEEREFDESRANRRLLRAQNTSTKKKNSSSTKSAQHRQQQQEEDEENEEEDEQQQHQGNKSPSSRVRGNRRPPTFGTTPYRLARLPYFSYYGKARNVDLVSSADRPTPATDQQQHNNNNNQTDSNSTSSSPAPAQNLEASDQNNSSADNRSQSGSSSSHSLSSARAHNQSASRIPTLSRTSALGGGKSQRHKGQRYQLSEIEQEDSKELELDRQQRFGRANSGYSNISNLFPNQPHRVRARGRSAESAQTQKHSIGGSQLSISKDLRFGGSQQKRVNHNDNHNDHQSNSQRKLQQSASLLNLSQRRAPTPAAKSSSQAAQPVESGRTTKNSLTTTTYNTYTVRNRSMNSLSQQQQYNTHTSENKQGTNKMRRQNSTATPTNKRSGARSSSTVGGGGGGYLRGHHRSPSASSLHYGGSAGVSPYGPTPVDPDCPVHGTYPPPPNGQLGVVGPHSKSSQHLSVGGGDPDLLYDNQLYGPAAGYYDQRPAPALKQSASLYSPTSPNLLGGAASSRPGSAYVSPSGRNSAALANPNAYYNSSSRFSMYHSPGAAGGRTSLAPTNEQLRRILGYQPHTKPIYLHPQWAYSRPFIHLQGTRSPSPNSPALGDMDDVDQDMGPHFEPYNQLQDTQAIRAVDFHPSGEVYAIGSNSRALRICAYPADYELRHFGSQDHVTTAPRILFKFLQVHRGSIYCVSFNSAGQLLATGSNDQTVHIVRYNSITHSPDGDEYRLTMHDGTVRDLCFIDDATNSSSLLLSAGGGDNKIYVTDCDTITPFQSMAGHTQMIMGLHHWGGANFVSASYDRTIRFWDLRSRACTSIISAPPSYGTGGKWAGPGAPVCSVKVDPSGRLLASGHTDSTCMLYDIRGARIIQAFKPHDDEIRTLSFSPKSYYLLTGGYDGRIVLSDLQGDLTQPLPSVCVAENDDKIVQAKWHPSDFTFVTTSADKSATLWAMPTE